MYSMLVLAIIGTGAVFTGTNPSYTPDELTHHLKTSRAKFLISEPEIVDALLAAARANRIPTQNLWIFNPLQQQQQQQKLPAGIKSWELLLEHGEQDWVRFNDIETARSTAAARLFSSGTTGLPKAVTITHYNLIAQHELTTKAHPRSYAVWFCLL